MTRRLRTSATLVTTVLATVLLTMPAAATEVDNVAAETGFGTGQWDGMIVTAIVGLLLGVLTFMTSDPSGIPRAHTESH